MYNRALLETDAPMGIEGLYELYKLKGRNFINGLIPDIQNAYAEKTDYYDPTDTYPLGKYYGAVTKYGDSPADQFIFPTSSSLDELGEYR